MHTISLKCANCGAPLNVPENASVATCAYCHAKLGVRRPKPLDNPPTPDASKPKQPPAAEEKPAPNAFTEVLEVARAGAHVVSAGASIVDNVSNILFWTKATIVLVALILVLGCCGIPSYFVYRLFSENARKRDPRVNDWRRPRRTSSVGYVTADAYRRSPKANHSWPAIKTVGTSPCATSATREMRSASTVMAPTGSRIRATTSGSGA